MIDVARWAQIKVLFDRAVQLSGAQRDEYVRHSCGSDTELSRELNSLLSTYDADSDLLDRPALVDARDLLEADIQDPELGRQIGQYLVSRRVGEGGMGIVYQATHAHDEDGRRVAIKLIRRGMDSEYILRRFRKEREILASLAHPNIAKLLDGGITDDGLPYFVMEFIDGELIDDYCRSHLLDIAQRTRLVRQICGALEYAHGRRIVHRDIKPGNILVEPVGTPKLLDFGIAKLIASENGATSQRTATELRIVTPDYASPEQLRGEPASERSDVYALGVVLYELVSGSHANTLAVQVEKLPRNLRLIISKASHEDPARRYCGMCEFGADIDRFLAGQPISAKPDSILYRVRRYIRHHSKFAWAASLLVAALSAAFLSWFVQRGSGLPSGSRRSVAVLDFRNVTGAPNTAWFSTALTEMLNGELSAGEKVRTIPGDTIARMRTDLWLEPAGSYSTALLHRIAARLHPDYIVAGSYLATGDKSDLLVRIDLRLQDVRTGFSLITWSDTGTPAEFPAIATRAGTKLRQALGVSTERIAVPPAFGNTETARLYAEGLNRIRSFDPLGARALLERAVAQNPSDSLSHAALASALAQLGYQSRAAEEAKRSMDFSSGLPNQRRLEVEASYYTLRRDWSNAAATYNKLWTEFSDNLDYGLDMAYAQTNGGNVPAARATITRLRERPAVSSEPRVDLAEALAAEVAGEPRQELQYAQIAASKARRAGATQTLAEALYYGGWARWLLGDLKGSEETYSEALNLFTEAGNQRRVIDIKSGIATVLLDEGRTLESAQMLQDALAIARKIGNRSLEGVVNNNLARCWEELGQLKNAQRAYEKTVEIDQELNDRSNLATAYLNLGGVLKDQGRFSDGERQLTDALNIARALGKKSTIAMTLSTLGEEKQAQGDLSQAWQLQSQALTLAREIGRKTSIASSLSGEAAILRSQAKWREAEEKYEEAARVATDAHSPAKLSEIRLDEAQLLTDEGMLRRAKKLASDALNEFKKENNPKQQALAEAILAEIAARQADAKQAQELSASARRHLGEGEVLITRLQVAEAEAFSATSGHNYSETLQILRNVATRARAAKLRETAWDAELLAADISPTPDAKIRVQQIKHDATAAGILRIAELPRRLQIRQGN